VEMEVRDHGPGVPATLAGRMFEPRVRGATDVAGAGLGLSIARGIVEAHGGMLATLDVERGAAFVVTLPAEPSPDAADGLADASWNLVEEPKEPHVL
jgi:signal transduction histidine kinase